jgi:chromosome segregation ATPase
LIEQAMIFALGVLAAGLLMLLMLPALWARAVRLTRRRLEMTMPLSLDEVAAERDQLRAEFAVERRRLEQRHEALADMRAADLAELGRRASRIARFAASEAELRDEVAHLSQSLATLGREAAETRSEASALHKALHDSEGLRERREAELHALEQAHEILRINAGQQRIALTDAETRLSVAEMGLGARDRQLREASRLLDERQKEIEILIGERSHARAQANSLAQRRDGLHADLAAAAERIAALEQALQKAREDVSNATIDVSHLRETIATRDKQLDEAQARAAAVKERGERALQQAYASERDMAQRLDAERAERSVVEGALRAARAERGRLQRDLAQLQARLASPEESRHAGAAPRSRPQPDDSEAALRQAISDVADRLLRLASPGMKAAAAPPLVSEETAAKGDLAAAPSGSLPRLRAQPKKPIDKVAANADPQ